MLRVALLFVCCASVLGCGSTPTSPAALSQVASNLVPERPLQLTGTYDLTLTADAVCTEVPAAYRARTFSVTVAPGREVHEYIGRITDAGIEPYYDAFTIRVSSSTLTLELNSRYAFEQWLDGLPVIERLSPREHYSVYGGSQATAFSDGRAVGQFTGDITYCSADEPPAHPTWARSCPVAVRKVCKSTQHEFELSRR